MTANPATLLVAAFGIAAVPVHAQAPIGPAPAAAGSEVAAGFVGTWELAVDDRTAACRLILRAEKSDKGDYFLGMAPACRHAMPSLAKVGRWGLPDATHLSLDEPGGAPVLTLAANGNRFTGAQGSRAFTLTRVGGPPPGTAGTALEGPEEPATVVPVGRRTTTPPDSETAPAARKVTDRPADLAGRYAVMREKRDTGCMLTLDDKTRGKAGGDRAQLAPGCRDQGIVVFDPVGWRLVKGELVLTARAGHSTRLEKVDDGRWAKDNKDGGKPLGLKKL